MPPASTRPPQVPTARGRLYLVPAPLDFGCRDATPLHAPDEVLPDHTMAVAARLQHWLCENAKSLRASLKRIHERHPLHIPLQQQHIVELPRLMHKKGDHIGASPRAGATAPSPAAVLRELLAPALAGHDMGLTSEAGMPAIADPGSSIVRAAHDWQIPVIPLTGPISLMLALAASGLNGQSFAFCGYLPQDSTLRANQIRALEKLALQSGQSQLFIETPYRNAAMIESLVSLLHPQTRLAVSWGLTLETVGLSHNASATVAQWRQPATRLMPDKHILDLPAVYIIGP
ncbi:MAG: SAM-dependent methyltransferase [Comamonas sp.]